MEESIARKHKIVTSIAEDVASRLAPGGMESLLITEDVTNVGVLKDSRPGRYESRAIPGVILLPPQTVHDNLILGRDSHRVVGVYRIGFEPIWECT